MINFVRYTSGSQECLRNYAINDGTPPFSAGYIPSSWNVARLARLMRASGPDLTAVGAPPALLWDLSAWMKVQGVNKSVHCRILSQSTHYCSGQVTNDFDSL